MSLEPCTFETAWGSAVLHRVRDFEREAYLLFRHGLPHRLLPNQIPYQAHAAALAKAGCRALLVTSSVGVLDAATPLFEPLVIDDLITLDNRLPDGSSCTMFTEPEADAGHLVLDEGLFSSQLSTQLAGLAERAGVPIAGHVSFGYVGGPRSKTAAENEMWRRLGAQVNSMTVAPEVVLANELEIPVAGLAVGHKYSLPRGRTPRSGDEVSLAESLQRSRSALERIVMAFLRHARPVPFANSVHRFAAGGE